MPEPPLRAAVERRQRVLGPAYKLFYDRPLEFVRADGVRLFDAEGNAYLDAYNNVPSVGHCHPYVVERVCRQLATLNTNTRYLSTRLVDYSERLLATHADELERVMLTCSGSEAVDLALRIAQRATRKRGIIVTENAYHGVTSATAAISPSLGLPLDPDVRAVPAPGSADTQTFHTAIETAIAELEESGSGIAAFIADSLLASDGVCPDPPGFLRIAADAVHHAGGLYIADEVQAGFSRTGTHFWGYQRHGVVPDIVAMGKPMGNGLPVAGIAARAEYVDLFGQETRYFNTFGGSNPLIAAADAVLDVLAQEQLASNAATVGEYLRSRLEALSASQARLGAIRGAGLYLGIDIVDSDGGLDAATARRLINRLRERRVLIGATGQAAATLKIRPPLPFSHADTDELLESLKAALEEC